MGFFSELTGNSKEHCEQIEPFAPAVGKAGFECGLGLLFPKRSFRQFFLSLLRTRRAVLSDTFSVSLGRSLPTKLSRASVNASTSESENVIVASGVPSLVPADVCLAGYESPGQLSDGFAGSEHRLARTCAR